MTISERNEEFLKHMDLIWRVIRRNYRLVQAVYDSIEDAYQDLAITMLHAIETYDPARHEPGAHYWSLMQYRILRVKEKQKPYGLTGAHYTIPVLELDMPLDDDGEFFYEIPVYDEDNTDLYINLSRLTPYEREVAEGIAYGKMAYSDYPRSTYLSARSKLVGCYAR